jgi:hypothetical protein
MAQETKELAVQVVVVQGQTQVFRAALEQRIPVVVALEVVLML